jgi:hypothetical protein
MIDSVQIIQTGSANPFRWDIFLVGLLLWASPLARIAFSACDPGGARSTESVP